MSRMRDMWTLQDMVSMTENFFLPNSSQNINVYDAQKSEDLLDPSNEKQEA